MKEKPVILITAGTEVFQKNRKRLFLYEEYALRIREIGGIPLMIADLDMPEEITALEQLADGLLLSGGGDVDPKWFGETDTQSGAVYDEKRDRMEIGLCRAFAAAKKPVLGICRGIQVINIALAVRFIRISKGRCIFLIPRERFMRYSCCRILFWKKYMERRY